MEKLTDKQIKARAYYAENAEKIKADAIRDACENAIKNKLNKWSVPYILLREYADKVERGEL